MIQSASSRLKTPDNHGWPSSLDEARREQLRLRDRVVTKDRLGLVRRVAGLDVHYDSGEHLAWAAAAVFSLPSLQLEESVLACQPIALPYVPGFLSYREAPVMLDTLPFLSQTPDLLLVDGQGLAHPRHFGLACHIGVLADVPTIGVAKSRLVGRYREPAADRGAWSRLTHDGRAVGAVLRTRTSVKPLFVSIGHRISLKTAIIYVLECTGRFRLPEPLRAADQLARVH